MSKLYSSAENFLQYGLGYALFYESKVVSEAYAHIGQGFAEISIRTDPEYRKQGYAQLVCNDLINELLLHYTCSKVWQSSLSTGDKLAKDK